MVINLLLSTGRLVSYAPVFDTYTLHTMTDRTRLINVLATVNLASAGNLAGLQNIIASDSSLLASPRSPLSAYSLILYFLPEAIPFKEYADFIHKCLNGSLIADGDLPDTEQLNALDDRVLSQRTSLVATYVSNKTANYGWVTSSAPSPHSEFLDDWIKARIRLVDSCTGLVDDTTPLFNISETADSDLFTWQYGIAQVISQFRNFYYTQSEWRSLQDFEALSPRVAVQLLLEFTSVETVVRDVNTLVVPYLTYKSAADNDYSALWEWVGQTASLNEEDPPAHLLLLLQLVEAGGISLPSDQAHFRFIRSVLAYMYAYPIAHYTDKTYAHFSELQKYLGDFELDSDTPDYKVPDDINESDLFLFDTLLTSKLTTPTLYSLELFDKFTSSAALLAGQVPDISLIEVVVTSLYGSEQDQIALARKYIFNDQDSWKTLDTAQWARVRDNLRWLKNKTKVLSKVPDTWIDETLLVSTLSCGRFDFVKTYFVDVRRTAVPTNTMTKHLLDAFYENYDMAASCSTARGTLKNAAACLNLLEEKHSKRKLPSEVSRASRLLTATNELSIYTLTMTPGVPLHPVELRIQTKDPLSIIHRVLELNAKSYQDLTKLQGIANNLIYGILGKDLLHTDLKVRGMCIEAALVDSNFEQAYLFTEALRQQAASTDEEVQQLTWTTCYQVGKFVSPYWDDMDASTAALVLEKQLELLTHTLATAPRENITSVLVAWKRIETELSELVEASNGPPVTSNTNTTTTTSGVRAVNEQKDTLKSAGSRFARAIQSSANATFGTIDPLGTAGADHTSNSSSSHEELQNSRKRDQLSGLLVSGLGWAIGANPK